MKFILGLLLASFFLSGCTFMLGAAAGGAAGYYLGKEGYKVKVEKEKD
jgi:outer membrane lipoprotein-sorting protein